MSGYKAVQLLASLHRGKRKKSDTSKGRRRRQKDKVLDAVALQDHLMRSLDLRQTRPKRSHVAKKREEDTTWTCNRCTLAHNSSTRQNCRACGAKRQRKRDDVSDLSYNPVHTLAMYVPLPLSITSHQHNQLNQEKRTRQASTPKTHRQRMDQY